MFPDGRHVVSGSLDGKLMLWRVPPTVLPPGTIEVVCQFDFAADQPGELSFKAGDVILTDAATFAFARDSGAWVLGELNGKQGFFPSNYCVPKYHIDHIIEETDPDQQQPDQQNIVSRPGIEIVVRRKRRER